MRDLIDMRVSGLGLAPARQASVISEAERLAYYGDQFDRIDDEGCMDQRGVHTGTRATARAPKAAAGVSAR